MRTPVTFADLIVEEHEDNDDTIGEEIDSDRSGDENDENSVAVESINPPSTKPGCLVVSRDVWEIVRLSDAVIRFDVEVQIEKLMAAVDSLITNQVSLPDELYWVQRCLWSSSRCLHNAARASEAKEEQNRLWNRYHMFRNYEEAIELLQSSLRPVAATWHSARRSGMLKKYGREVTTLMRDDPLTPACLLVIIVGHLWVAFNLDTISENVFGVDTSVGLRSLTTFAAAALFGGFCAFGFQALDHELSHCTSLIPTWVGGPRYSSRVNAAFGHSLGLLGSACTTVPWFSYYFSGGEYSALFYVVDFYKVKNFHMRIILCSHLCYHC
jgi:hypothetical protein